MFYFFYRIVFWAVFGILIGTGLIYLLFADGKIQSWNDPKSSSRTSKETSPEIESAQEMKETFVKNF